MKKHEMNRRTFGTLAAGAVVAGTSLPAHAAGDVLDDDRVFTRGNREGWATNADT